MYQVSNNAYVSDEKLHPKSHMYLTPNGGVQAACVRCVTAKCMLSDVNGTSITSRCSLCPIQHIQRTGVGGDSACG